MNSLVAFQFLNDNNLPSLEEITAGLNNILNPKKDDDLVDNDNLNPGNDVNDQIANDNQDIDNFDGINDGYTDPNTEDASYQNLEQDHLNNYDYDGVNTDNDQTEDQFTDIYNEKDDIEKELDSDL